MNSKSTPRLLQQQPGSGGNAPQQMGEGSYQASEDYKKSIQAYLDKADVQADAAAAKPSSQGEAREMEAAEKEGLSHSKAPGQ